MSNLGQEEKELQVEPLEWPIARPAPAVPQPAPETIPAEPVRMPEK